MIDPLLKKLYKERKYWEVCCEKIIFVRHGDYHDCDGSLNDRGREQLQRVGSLLLAEVGGESCRIISSFFDRTMQSAAILQEILAEDITVEETSLLAYADFLPGGNVSEICKKLETFLGEIPVIILVGHASLGLAIPRIIENVYSATFPDSCRLGYGCACVADFSGDTPSYRSINPSE